MAAVHGWLHRLRGEILNEPTDSALLAAKRKERQAWIVLLSAFAAFLVIAALVPYSVYRFYQTATVAKSGTLEVVNGTVRISRPAASADVAANNRDPILEGFTIKTDNTSRALLTLFDGSTVYIFENSELTVNTLRVSRFTNSRTFIRLTESTGRVRVGVAPPITENMEFRVSSPHAVMTLVDGSYAVQVGADGTLITTRAGSATVAAQGVSVVVGRAQRTTVLPGGQPEPVGPAAMDLIRNGDFRQGEEGWIRKAEVEAGRRDDIYGQTLFLTDSEGPGYRFVRRGSRNSHGENGILQTIDRDVSDFVSLRLSLDFRVIYQSLSGGGYLGSEYPLIVNVIYRDASGAQVTWSRGFYYQNDEGYPTTYGEQVPAEVWIPYEKNLLELEGYPKPFRLLSISIMASGWDYESIVKSVSILAE